MSEHWKSTPKYWCKHCQVFVRDTKLERANHEATGKHQGALKRFLRDLHRGHEKEEKDKERARQEIARLNGVVGGGSGSSSSATQASDAKPQQSSQPAKATEAQLQKQREQLLALGVVLPDANAKQTEVAAPGEWTVTQTRIIEPTKYEDEETKVQRLATGVRKREVTEEEKEEEDAMQSLFKKPRRWGRDSRAMPAEEDKELDALLSGSVITLKKTEDEGSAKKEEEEDGVAVKEDLEVAPVRADVDVKREEGKVKMEPEDAVQGISTDITEQATEAPVKLETGDGTPAPVFFKKRKAKGLRQK